MIPVQDTVPGRNLPIVTWGLIALNAGIFLWEATMPARELLNFLHSFGMVPARFSHPAWASWAGYPPGDIVPFFTSMFLHGGLVHILSNMWTLWIFGNNVEDEMGPVRFLLFYILCGLVAGLFHWATNVHSTLPALGASGAIAGVMGAYFLMFPRARVVTVVPMFFWPHTVEVPAFFFMMVWFLSQFFNGTLALANSVQAGGVAWWAHVGGFLTGMAASRFFTVKKAARGSWQRDAWF